MKSWMFFLLSGSMLVTSQCNREAVPEPKKKLNYITGQSFERFPGEPIQLPDQLASKFKNALYLDEIFQVEQILPLEIGEGSYIKEIMDVAFLNSTWYVLDFWSNQVLRFDVRGKFLGLLGRRGKGPGEYTQPMALTRCFDGKLAVADYGKILIYDDAANFLFETGDRSKTEWLVLSNSFIWDERDFLYAIGYIAREANEPAHALLAYQNEGNQFKRMGGFGVRFKPVETYAGLESRKWKHSCFSKIEGRIWVGSPYSCQLEVFDCQGRKMASLPSLHPNGLSFEDFDNIKLTHQSIAKLMLSKIVNISLHQAGPLVVHQLTAGRTGIGTFYDIYDTMGNPLARELRMETTQKFGLSVDILDSFGDRIVGVFGGCQDLSLFENEFPSLPYEGLEALRASGWRPGANVNPMLWIGKLRQ